MVYNGSVHSKLAYGSMNNISVKQKEAIRTLSVNHKFAYTCSL